MPRITGSDDLFRLVKSLTAEEKGYFKKFAKRHVLEGNKHLQLFDAVNQQEKFEELLLKRKFAGYADMKGYLFDMIMKSLLVSKKDIDKRAGLLLQIIYCYLLQQKGLLVKARQLMQKILQEAREGDFFWLEEEMLRNQNTILRNSWTPLEKKQKTFQMFAAIEKARNKQINKDLFLKEGVKLTYLEEQRNFGKETRVDLEKEINILLLEDAASALSTSAERVRCMDLFQYHFAKNNYEKGYSVLSKWFRFEKKLVDSGHFSANMNFYMIALGVLAPACLSTGRYKEAVNHLDKDWRMPSNAEVQRRRYFYDFVYNKAQYYWVSAHHHEGEKFINEHLENVLNGKNQERDMPHVLDIMKFMILFQFSNAHYREALVTINEFEEMDLKKYSAKYFKHCEIMRIIIQVELGNFDQMKNLIHNLLKKSKALDLSNLEREFLTILKKMHNMNHRQVYRELLSSFSSSEKRMELFLALDISWWLRAKLNGVPLSKIIRTIPENKRLVV